MLKCYNASMENIVALTHCSIIAFIINESAKNHFIYYLNGISAFLIRTFYSFCKLLKLTLP